MAIEVEIYERIRHLHEHEDLSQRSIAKILGISRNTVKRYFNGSHVPWEREGTSGRNRYIITDEVSDFIKACLVEDETENIKKQKHTAKRIYDRLVAEKGFPGGESTIREVVSELKAKQSKVFIPLSYDPSRWTGEKPPCTYQVKRLKLIYGVCGNVIVPICSAKRFIDKTKKVCSFMRFFRLSYKKGYRFPRLHCLITQ